jgi:cell wall-associated NlpC family hydrolase
VGNAVVPLLILTVGGVAVWGGIADPQGGIVHGLSNLMRGGSNVAKADTQLAAYVTAATASAPTSQPPTSSAAYTGHGAPRTSPGAPTLNPGTGKGAEVVAASATWLGVPYHFGWSSRAGIDCSGLTMRCYETVGVMLPHNAAAQEVLGMKTANPSPGDLAFFSIHGVTSHCGIVLGNGSVRHAPHTGAVVRDETIASICADGHKVSSYRTYFAASKAATHAARTVSA